MIRYKSGNSMVSAKLNFIFVVALTFVTLQANSVYAQTRIDSSFAFQTDPAKKYALYAPSGYQDGVENKAVLAFHPLHQVWGNSKTWCDILTNFAEENDLLMICPDGGADLRVDDPIDLAFTTALLDSLNTWYTVDPDKVFILGFSWGGRTTYTYGLSNPDVFAGYITIGSFVNGTQQVGPGLLANAENKPFYIMHGDSDAVVDLQTGFFPIRDALIGAGAIVESMVLENVGHTIDFPDRDQILNDAFHWVDSTSTAITAVGVEDEPEIGPQQQGVLSPNYPNPFKRSTVISYTIQRPGHVKLEIFDLTGRLVDTIVDRPAIAGQHSVTWEAIDANGVALPGGVYFYSMTSEDGSRHARPLIVLR